MTVMAHIVLTRVITYSRTPFSFVTRVFNPERTVCRLLGSIKLTYAVVSTMNGRTRSGFFIRDLLVRILVRKNAYQNGKSWSKFRTERFETVRSGIWSGFQKFSENPDLSKIVILVFFYNFPKSVPRTGPNKISVLKSERTVPIRTYGRSDSLWLLP